MSFREHCSAYWIGTLFVITSMTLAVWLLTWPALFRLYYPALHVSPHPQDAVAIVQWLSSHHRERSLYLALAEGKLTEKELKHYSDVRRVFRWLPKVAAGLVLLTAASLAILRPPLQVLAAAQRSAIVAWLLFLLITGAAACYDWKAFFATMHQPLFGERSWRLPRNSYSLRLFPASFWQMTALAVMLAPGAILGLTGLTIRRRATRAAGVG